ncbi:hypothetical protein GGR50DRAFT_693191 [Xylaria sp. CBS 124048]|nr:hypothetical protein GGR50DRAFT_693191 [Xylaria sp. CBS 124048]
MCGCERTTYLCLCYHKERTIERCFIYQLRERGSCLAWCFPRCRASVRRYRLKRVCQECHDYFFNRYGKDHFKQFIEYFLAYKEAKGWSKCVIDPRTVAREVLLNRHSAPAEMVTQREPQGRGRGLIITSMTNPMESHQFYTGEAELKRPASSRVSSKNRITPVRTGSSPARENEDEYEFDDNVHAHVSASSPKARHGNGNNRPTRLPMIPEFAHLAAQGQANISQCTPPDLHQPIAGPRNRGQHVARHSDSGSDISIIKNLTKLARDIDIPNVEYIEHEGMLVPRLLPVPEGRRRTCTPISSPAQSQHATLEGPYDCNNSSENDLTPAANAGPSPLVTEFHKPYSTDDSPSAYSVHSSPISRPSSGASACVRINPSDESVTIPPPQRLNGVLIPWSKDCALHSQDEDKFGRCAACRGAFFQERGLPPSSYVEEACRSAPLLKPSVLLTVNAPRRRYSCAVQSCFCADGDTDDEKCPSCQERDSIAQEFKTTWI